MNVVQVHNGNFQSYIVKSVNSKAATIKIRCGQHQNVVGNNHLLDSGQ